MPNNPVYGVIDATGAFTWVSGGTNPGPTLDERNPPEIKKDQIFTYNGGSQQTVIVEDNDPHFYTHDSVQKTAEEVTIDGVTYPAGTLINLSAQVDFIDTATGDEYRLHFGSMGTGSYGFTDSDFYIWSGKNAPPVGAELRVKSDARFTYAVPYSSVTCFAAGTMIDTPQGPIPIEGLRVGDTVTTATDGDQPIRWIGSRRLNAGELAVQPCLRPIRIKAGALRPGIPQTDLLVSPQHRIRLSSHIIQRMFGSEEVLISAKKLLDLPGVDVCPDTRQIEYYHLALSRHNMVRSNGAWTETLYPGKEALKSMDAEALAELQALFPDFVQAKPDSGIEPAALFVEKRPRIKKMVERHIKNNKALIAE